MVKSRIIGTGFYVPPKVLTNYELEKLVDTTDQWISERTGIKERRIAESETPSDLAAKAALRALERARVKPTDINLIIVATVTPDMAFPSTACFVQEKIGAVGASAFDVSAACSGFIYALDIADRYIRSGNIEKVLVIGVDCFSRLINWQDRTTCILFGDGAGAVVLSKGSSQKGILSTHTYSNGTQWRMLYAPLDGVVSIPIFLKKGETIEEKRALSKTGVKMQGNETFKVAVKMMENASLEALKLNGLKVEDIALFIPHQANARIIKATAQRLGMPMERVYMNIERYGNTSAASIPIAMDEAYEEGRIRDGDLVLLAAFGGGFTWASALIRW